MTESLQWITLSSESSASVVHAIKLTKTQSEVSYLLGVSNAAHQLFTEAELRKGGAISAPECNFYRVEIWRLAHRTVGGQLTWNAGRETGQTAQRLRRWLLDGAAQLTRSESICQSCRLRASRQLALHS